MSDRTEAEGYLNTNAHLEAQVVILRQQLAESQAREAKLRKLIHDGCLCIAQYGEQPPQPLLDAIAMQTDTSALREMIEAAKAEEREALTLPVFDGNAVYSARRDDAKKRTSPKNVSDA